VWTEEDDKEIEYGKWNAYDANDCLAEEYKIHPPKVIEDIRPHWSQGVPTILRKRTRISPFFLNGVHYRCREVYETREYHWRRERSLSELKNDSKLLPGTYTSEWSGVYRVFAPSRIIKRSWGQDPTGTLYVGKAGTGKRHWSILRTRIQEVVDKRHHTTINWHLREIEKKFPWDSLAIEWAYTGMGVDYQGEAEAEANLAEGWLLDCYIDSYGQLPPWNQRRA
jgi:hypothetical protein